VTSHAFQPCFKEEESLLEKVVNGQEEESLLEKVVNGLKNVTFIGSKINIAGLQVSALLLTFKIV